MKINVSEPVATYNTPYLQGLKNRIIASLETTTDEEKLQRCWELLNEDRMPCRFTEEELDDEIRLSEASGYVSNEEVLARLAGWGFGRNAYNRNIG